MPGQFIPGRRLAQPRLRRLRRGRHRRRIDDARVRLGDRLHLLHAGEGAPRRVRRPPAALGQRQGHRPRAAAAMGREAVAGDVGGARGRQHAAADRLPQHDRQHDGGGGSAERHLRARRHDLRVVPAEGHHRRCRIRRSRPAPNARYEIDETARSRRRAADDRQAVQPRQRVSGGGGRARAHHVRQGDDRLVHQRQLRRSAAGGARAARGARRRASKKVDREFRIFPGSGGVGRQIEQPDARLGGESIAEVFRSVGGEIRQSWCGPCFGQGPDALTAGQRAITSFNRNWQNRMGLGGEGYLASPAVVAASALVGYMAPPERAGARVGSRERFGV